MKKISVILENGLVENNFELYHYSVYIKKLICSMKNPIPKSQRLIVVVGDDMMNRKAIIHKKTSSNFPTFGLF